MSQMQNHAHGTALVTIMCATANNQTPPPFTAQDGGGPQRLPRQDTRAVRPGLLSTL